MTIDNIIKIVCQEYELSPDEIQLPTKTQPIIEARQVCHSFAKELTEFTYAYIGMKIGGKDHATVIHSVKSIENLCFTDRKLSTRIDKIRIELNNFDNKQIISNEELLSIYDKEIMNTFQMNDIFV